MGSDSIEFVPFRRARANFALDAAAVATVQTQVRHRALRAFVRRGLLSRGTPPRRNTHCPCLP
jgi:hypothetical protein